MKKIVLFATACIACKCQLAQSNYSEKGLISYFKKIELPFTTDQLYHTRVELPYELSLKYFFKNDSAYAQYYYEVENMEDFSIMAFGYERKKVFPCNFFHRSGKLFLIYRLLDEAYPADPRTYLSIWQDGVQLDNLVIFYATTSAPEHYNTVKSKIYEDRVIVFDYRLVCGRERDEKGIKTKIEVNFYSMDLDKGKFVKIKTEIFESTEFELYQFNEGKIEEVIQEDPFYKY